MPAEPYQLTDNPSIAGRMDRFMTVRIDVAKVLGSWRQSLMAHEWLNPDGSLRDTDRLNLLDRDRVLKLKKSLNGRQPLPRPVLGIGLFDNVEIGAARDVFFLLALAGHATLDVHIPKGNEKEFKPFLG